MRQVQQQGAVLITTLWVIALVTILVTTIAGEVKLSARAAFYHQEELSKWASIQSAINQAEMELMLERMPRPAEVIEELNELNRNPLFRYNGQPLELSYSAPEDFIVRVYDHAGKINLRSITRPKMRALLEKRLGSGEDQQIQELIAAWSDWIDLNDGESVNGAERDYYQSLDLPYEPRNGQIETLEEILLIRGFEDVFEDIDLSAAFTLYTESELINLNLATVEAMRLLPGLDNELIEDIVLFRQEGDFRGNAAFDQIIEVEQMAELRPWLDNSAVSNFYTILAYHQASSNPESEEEQEGSSTTAYSEIIEINSATQKPLILTLNPYGSIPEN